MKGLRKLVRYGARIRCRNGFGKTPLHMALEAGKLKATTFLMGEGHSKPPADMNDQGRWCQGSAALGDVMHWMTM